MIRSRGRLSQFFSPESRSILTALVLCWLAVFSAIPGHAASNKSVCRLTISVTVAPTVQNNGVVALMNSLPVPPASSAGVTFNLTPNNSPVTSSQIDTREVSMDSQTAGESIALAGQGQPTILKTLTVVPR